MRAYRTDTGLSQEHFADSIGMHRVYYSSVERGERNITLATLQRIAQGLGVPMADLLVAADD